MAYVWRSEAHLRCPFTSLETEFVCLQCASARPADLLASRFPPVSTSFTIGALRLHRPCYPAQALRIQIQVCMLAWQVLHPLSHLHRTYL